ncbi:MAG: PIG-L family deacetylase [Anaerolineales bacterium]|nr:PIG-L family deacetylase [Anaerolineales bacterium]
MRWIYISPHFDDAVLSCGGLIWEQTHSGIPVEIWTIMAGDPPIGAESALAQQLHASWQTANAQETVTLRRGEDQNSARRVGASIHHFPFPDSIYRRSQTGTLYYPEGIFVPPNPREGALVQEIAEQVAARLRQYDTIVCPLAIGGHVDHVLTRKAIEQLGRPLWYYADVPYVFWHADSLAPMTEGMTGKTFFISAQGLAGWQDSIEAHASQITSLFADVADMRQKIKEYAHRQNGLVLWERDNTA